MLFPDCKPSLRRITQNYHHLITQEAIVNKIFVKCRIECFFVNVIYYFSGFCSDLITILVIPSELIQHPKYGYDMAAKSKEEHVNSIGGTWIVSGYSR